MTYTLVCATDQDTLTNPSLCGLCKNLAPENLSRYLDFASQNLCASETRAFGAQDRASRSFVSLSRRVRSLTKTTRTRKQMRWNPSFIFKMGLQFAASYGDNSDCEMFWVLSRVLGSNCVTCSYVDKFEAFHNRMSVIHNILSNFYKPYIFIKLKVQGR